MRLFIRILSASEPTDRGESQTVDTIACQWLLRADGGQALARGDSLAEGLTDTIGPEGVRDAASALADPENVVVLVPTAQVAWLSRAVPGRRPAQIRRALPFAVEEFLTQDVETMHLAHGAIVRGQPVRCALLDRQLLTDWLNCLRDCGLRPGHMVPDGALLPCDEGSASVLFEDGVALVRTPEHIANVEASTLPDILESIRASFDEADESIRLELIGDDISGTPTGGSDFSVSRTHLDGPVLDFLAAQWEGNRPEINLLQGPFAPERRGSASPGRWRSVSALAAVWLIVALAWLIAEGYVANQRADALEAESKDLYRSIYPNDRRIPNAFAQMRAKLRGSDAGEGAFHVLLGQLAAGTVQANAEINVRSITFNDSRGELTSELWLPGYAQIDGLKRELEERGLAVDISSAEERDNIVRARLRIRVPGRVPGGVPG